MPLVTLDQLVAQAQANEVVSFPTDTVPAVAVKPDYAQKIYELKRRSPDKPLILMAASLEEIWDYVVGSETEKTQWQAIAQKYLPGALTLVLPASELVSSAINPTKSGTIGVRVPDLDIAREILSQTGAMATTSANLSGQPPIEWTEEIALTFPSLPVLDCWDVEQFGKIGSGQPSTVIQWQRDSTWTVLRQGSIALETTEFA
ncbi:SUA5/yciO/yrdC domain protein [[Leptolyngbya] sp. PCC 7376]|uniref:L-threonylcarbamoyladenylate synthase n=1 Tax=[Leptolyngbya] sp. PCC 7376 TaxID=111781 RepID=UPI00029F196E|nr:L-threonylcarbamoyladenylate synthase [[Leptolyngbya] sp. PCC 7376]AFY38324.1 SUA5/yciO/yrdC domain protein [[Leptolyngbya] sp. PCC 7376]